MQIPIHARKCLRIYFYQIYQIEQTYAHFHRIHSSESFRLKNSYRAPVIQPITVHVCSRFLFSENEFWHGVRCVAVKI